MATIPVPHTFVAGDDATSAVMQTLTDAILFLLGSATSGGSKKANFRGRGTVAQNLATSGTAAALLLDTEDVDYDNGHSTVTNTSRYTAQAAGWHDVSANVAFTATAAGGQRIAFIAVNGTERTQTRVEHAPAGTAVPTCIATHSDLVFLNVGDFVEVWGLQTSGGALTVANCALVVEWRSN